MLAHFMRPKLARTEVSRLRLVIIGATLACDLGQGTQGFPFLGRARLDPGMIASCGRAGLSSRVIPGAHSAVGRLAEQATGVG